jgi:alpha-ketoglutarate-dependent taurine dioxygenase
MSPAAVSTEVTAGQGALIIHWGDGTYGEFASIWLRDNLPEDRDSHSGQRLIDVTDLPQEPRIRSATLLEADLLISWQGEDRSSIIKLDWLYQQCGTGAAAEAAFSPQPWLEGARLDAQRDFAWQSASTLATDTAARREWLLRLLQQGIAFLRDVPRIDAGIVDAMEPVGRVAETNYGLVFDVRAVPQPENLAYSDVGLGLHTDNPYREPVPGFQALHTLVAAPDGGDNLFADGWALAAHLRDTDPDTFAVLTSTAVPFRYQSKQADLYAERPLISLDCSGSIVAVHYNSRSIAPLRLPVAECRAFYAAYRRFGELLRERAFQLTTRLADGDLVLFDNQRILHGRTGFASARHPRHLRGCYLTRDSVYSQAALLQRPGDRGGPT